MVFLIDLFSLYYISTSNTYLNSKTNNQQQQQKSVSTEEFDLADQSVVPELGASVDHSDCSPSPSKHRSQEAQTFGQGHGSSSAGHLSPQSRGTHPSHLVSGQRYQVLLVRKLSYD